MFFDAILKQLPKSQIESPTSAGRNHIGWQGESTCSISILSLEGTWNVVAVCSSRNCFKAMATGLFS